MNMAWLAENWFWVLIVAVFLGAHFFGHKGHRGGHGTHAKHGGGGCGGESGQEENHDEPASHITDTGKDSITKHLQ